MSNKYNKKLDAAKANILVKPVGKTIKTAMKEYGLYTLYDRAVPQIVDGLKPVYRRSMFAMHQMGAVVGKPHKKVARISGEVIGKYHPHGDKSVQDVIVLMAHTRYQLVDPQGNFGTRTTSAAAGRYIEARLSKFGVAVCERLNIAKMVPNFDGEEIEPCNIPTNIPLIFLNGTPTGIALGLRVGIPSHNMNQTVAALTYVLKAKKPKENKFLDLLDRPDFRECVITSTKEEVREIYKTGYGSIQLRPKYEYTKQGESLILSITGLPPNINIKNKIEKIRESYQKEGMIDYVNEQITSKKTINGHRPIDSVKVKASSKKILQEVLAEFNSSFYINLYGVIGVDKNKPEVPSFSFFTMAQKWLEYQLVFKKTELNTLLAKKDKECRVNKARYQIVSSKKNLDKLIALLRKKLKTNEDYIKAIAKTFKMDNEQAEALYNSQLRTLANLNIQTLKEKIEKLEKEIKAVKKKLKDIPACIIEDLESLVKVFGDDNETVYATEFKVKGERLKGQAMIIGVSESGKVYNDKFPKNIPIKNIQNIEEGALAIAKDGLAYEYDSSELVGSLGHSVVGLVPYAYAYTLVMDNNCKMLLLDMEEKIEGKKTVMRDIGEVVTVVGVNKGDTVYVSKKKYPTVEYQVNDSFIKKFSKRSGSVGVNAMSGHKRGVALLVLGQTQEVFDEEGTKLNDRKLLKALEKGKTVISIGESTLIRKGTTVETVDFDEAVSYIGTRTEIGN